MEYFLCSTPRVGSNLLCSLLQLTERAGHPGEFFCPGEMALRRPKLGDVRFHEGIPVDFQAYYDRCREVYTSESGHFGAKAHAAQLRWALERGFQFERNMPTRFVHMTRADVVGQAISYSRAQQTGAWISAHAEKKEPEFNAEGVRSSLEQIVSGNDGWERLFKAYDIEPYRVSYEQLTANMLDEYKGILDYLEVDQDGLDLERFVDGTKGYFKQQRDEVTEHWRKMWTEEVRQNAASRENGAIPSLTSR